MIEGRRNIEEKDVLYKELKFHSVSTRMNDFIIIILCSALICEGASKVKLDYSDAHVPEETISLVMTPPVALLPTGVMSPSFGNFQFPVSGKWGAG